MQDLKSVSVWNKLRISTCCLTRQQFFNSFLSCKDVYYHKPDHGWDLSVHERLPPSHSFWNIKVSKLEKTQKKKKFKMTCLCTGARVPASRFSALANFYRDFGNISRSDFFLTFRFVEMRNKLLLLAWKCVLIPGEACRKAVASKVSDRGYFQPADSASATAGVWSCEEFLSALITGTRLMSADILPKATKEGYIFSSCVATSQLQISW